MSTSMNPGGADRRDTTSSTDDRPARSQSNQTAADTGLNRREVEQRQKDRFGGMKFGACFFGWLTATGTAVLLSALTAAVLAGAADAGAEPAAVDMQTGGIVGAIVALVVIAVAYFCGGYVAGRMARFSGVKQGIGVWLWAVIIAVVAAVLGLIAGDRFNALGRLDGLPRLPVDGSTATAGAVISLLVLAAVALAGAILGGLTGMRYHRRVDRADLRAT